MTTVITILHIIVALALILIVLLQTGKGAGIGAAFGGGGSGTVFGSRGPAGFLSKITAAAAIVFMITSLGLNLFQNVQVGGDSIMDSLSAPTQDETAPAPEETAAPVETAPQMPADQAQPIQPDSDSSQ